MPENLKKHLVTVAVSRWEDRAVLAHDTNEAKRLALSGEYEVAASETTDETIISTEIVGPAPEGSQPGSWRLKVPPGGDL